MTDTNTPRDYFALAVSLVRRCLRRAVLRLEPCPIVTGVDDEPAGIRNVKAELDHLDTDSWLQSGRSLANRTCSFKTKGFEVHPINVQVFLRLLMPLGKMTCLPWRKETVFPKTCSLRRGSRRRSAIEGQGYSVQLEGARPMTTRQTFS